LEHPCSCGKNSKDSKKKVDLILLGLVIKIDYRSFSLPKCFVKSKHFAFTGPLSYFVDTTAADCCYYCLALSSYFALNLANGIDYLTTIV
jgi:hypothetical protein